jgi:hypothetical protein
MSDDGSPFIDAKSAADSAKMQLDEFSKTLIIPIPLLTVLIGILASRKEQVLFLGADVSRAWAIMMGLVTVFVLSAHCCRLLSSLVNITRIHAELPVQTMLRFHPGLFNPFIMAWPKEPKGFGRLAVWPSIWTVVCTGRFGAFFVLTFPVGLGFVLSFDKGFLPLRPWSTIFFLLFGFFGMLLVGLVAATIHQVDANIDDPSIPKEYWQSVLGFISGAVLGGIFGFSVVQRD